MSKPGGRLAIAAALVVVAAGCKTAVQTYGPTDLSVFRAELTGLTPGTEYEFKIGINSPAYRFRTMPAKATKAFTFVSGGDCGVNAHVLNNNRVAARQDPMFALIGGDLAYDNGTNGSVALQFVKNYSQTMIDTQGRLQGYMIVRWVLADDPPHPTCELVDLDSLRDA